MSFTNKNDEHLSRYVEELREKKSPCLWQYWEEFGNSDDYAFLWCLLQEDFRERYRQAESENTDFPWFDDHLATGYLWGFRELACDAWSEMLYGDDTSLAESLGVLHFGSYKAERVAGIGGFGTVIQACDPDTGQHVAIKLPHRSGEAIEFLRQEMIMIKVLPPRRGLPSLIGTENHTLVGRYMITPWVKGVTLTQWLATNPTGPHRLEVSRHLAELVHKLEHRQGIFHGDISPDNILIEGESGSAVVHLVDFATSACGFLKRGMYPVFTRMYTAPELLIGKALQPTTLSDLWSLSVIIYQILMDRHPFGEIDDEALSDDEYFKRVSAPYPPTQLASQWGKLGERISICLRPNPNDRAGMNAGIIVNNIPTNEEVLNASSMRQNSTLTSRRNIDLSLDYLDNVIRRFGTLTIPLLRDADQKAVFPIAPLMVELPLQVHSNPEEYNSTLGRSHVFKIEYEKDKWEAEKKILQASVPTTLSDCCQMNAATAFIGHPGSGKSTILHWIAYRWATKCRADISGDKVIDSQANGHAPDVPSTPLFPVVLVCRELGKISADCTLPDIIELQLDAWGYSPSQRTLLSSEFLEQLRMGKASLIVDGLDELSSPEVRKHVAEMLNKSASEAKFKILITARSVGYRHMQAYLPHFAHVVIGKIQPETREAYVRGFGKQIDVDVEELVSRVCSDDQLGRLCESMLMLVLVAQISVIDRSLPNREVEVYQRAIELLLENQYAGDRPLIEANEFYPHLEHLAHHMHTNRHQHLWDIRVVEEFVNARAIAISDFDLHSMSKRSESELLEDIVKRVQILNIAGVDKDKQSGRMRDRIQFMHQRFQEYLAGRIALQSIDVEIDSRDLLDEEMFERFPGLVRIISEWKSGTRPLVSRLIELSTTHSFSEYTVSSEDYDTIPLWIAQLVSEDPELADEIFGLFEVEHDDIPGLSRALSVLALRCLGDDPPVSSSIATSVIQRALCELSPADCRSNVTKTMLDEAVEMIASTPHQELFCSIALQGVLEPDDSVSQQYSSAYLNSQKKSITEIAESDSVRSYVNSLVEMLESEEEICQVSAALQVVEFYYLTSQSTASFDQETQEAFQIQEKLLNACLVVAQKDKGHSRTVALWAISWLVGAVYLKYYTHFRPKEGLHTAIRQILSDKTRSPRSIRYACRILSVRDGYEAATEQKDWIYNLAVVADGGKPQVQLKYKEKSGYSSDTIECLRTVLQTHADTKVQRDAALALTRIGVFESAMHSPLLDYFDEDTEEKELRDEALSSLILLGGLSVWEALIERSRASDPGEPYGLKNRAFLGLMKCSDPDMMKREMIYCNTAVDEDNYMQSYAYVLAGMKSKQGRECLDQLQGHESDKIVKAVEKAIEKAKEWGMWPKSPELEGD